jgi:RNA polymerase sigma-70 factor (ECF subfamily)
MSSPFSAARFLTLPVRKDRGATGPLPKNLIAPAEEPSDESLIARVCAGECQALAVLFKRYARVTRSVAFRILRDSAEADDLVQDLFLFIQRRSSVFDGSKSSAGSWIVQMAYQRAIERRRRLITRHFYKHEDLQNNASQVVGIPTTEHDYSPEAVFGRNGLQKILAGLSEDQRETLRLFFFDGYTLSEISAKLGQPLGNVRNHYYRGLERLRKQMFGNKVPGR